MSNAIPDARLPRPACGLCHNHRTISLATHNIACPRCSAPGEPAGDALVFGCPGCNRRESVTAGALCGGCRGRIRIRTAPSESWSYAAIDIDRRPA